MKSDSIIHYFTSPRQKSRSGGFTLVEILVVLTVIVIMMSAAASGLGGRQRAVSLTNTGNRVAQIMEIARQRAMTGNVLTAVVVLTNLNVEEDGRAIAVLEYPTGGPWQQIRNWEILPSGFTVDVGDAAQSTFLKNSPQPFPFSTESGAPVKFRGKDVAADTYAARIFLPSGGLLNPNDPAQLQLVEGNVLGGKTTYLRVNSSGKQSNYYRINLIGATGKTKVERP